MEIELKNKYITNLFVADNQVIMANDEEDMDYMIRKLTEEYENWGLTTNINKTEYLRIKDEERDPQISIRYIKDCKEFFAFYLTTVIAKKGTSKRDIQQKIQLGRNVVQTLNSLLCSPPASPMKEKKSWKW
ncbi:uncharacterized protein [Diabrotica undecimpunctata]|uniref:uncharacterized protein n=1 Tax=Diabrotica undecimpunctata TaxID=50387 RepID=UPI003B63B350